MEMKKHYIPITKVNKEKRLVYLRAASETTDYADESMDYEGSKPNFQKWSDEAYERSGGKSYGNIREMHSAIAAGKLKEPLIFDDVNKTVDIVVYVSDDSSWQKVKDGVLTGASIGGSYQDIKFDPVLGVKRYIADLTEISLVDSPCNPDAVIEVIKSNGSVELMKVGTSLEGRKEMSKLEELMPGLKKNLVSEKLKKSFSFDDIVSRVTMAIKSRVQDNKIVPTSGGGYSYGYDNYWNYGYFSVTATYDDSVVIYGYFGDNANPYYIQVYYTIDEDGIVTLGDSQIVHMTPTPCHDVDGNDEALDLLCGDEDDDDDMSKMTKVSKRPDVSNSDKKNAESKYGDVEYADEKNKKYPIDTEKHVRAAASYFGQAKNRAKYSAADQKKIDAKIAAAKKKFGIGSENKKFAGGINIMEFGTLQKAMENPELFKAIETVVSLTGTDEEKEALAKAKKDAGMDKEDMEESKKTKKAKSDKDPDKDGDDDSTAEGDTDEDAGAGKKKAKKFLEDDGDNQLAKAYGVGIQALMKSNEMLMNRIERLEGQPMAGGPAVNGAGTPVSKSIGAVPTEQVDPLDQRIAVLKSVADASTDMHTKDALNKEIGGLLMQKARQNPIQIMG